MTYPKVSVIIPVYKAEKFIEKCCRSLFEQTLDDMEYIFVNDCTPDNSIGIILKILNDYPNRRSQVNILNHETNKGVAISRENGNQFATGEYIIHCDSDDWVNKEAYKIMYTAGIEQNAEIVCCGYFSVSECKQILYKYEIKEENKENLKFEIQPLYGAIWNKLIRKSLYTNNNIHIFNGINNSEDLGLVLRLRYFSKKTIFIDKPLYYHTADNINSIVSNYSLAKGMEIVKCAKELESFFQILNLEKEFYLQIQYLKFQAKQSIMLNSSIRDIRKWKTIFPETHQYIWKFKGSPFNIRLIAWSIAHRMNFIANVLFLIRDNI